MKASRLQKLRGIYPPEVPPRGSEAYSRTPNGKTVYRRKSNPRQKVPVLDDDGKQVTRGGNPLTGEPGTPVFKHVKKYPDPKPGETPRATVHFEWEYFTITRGRHGNNRIVPYNPEEAKREQAKKEALNRKDRLLEQVASRAAEVGMSIEEAVDRLLGLHEPDVPEDEVPQAPERSAGAELRALAEEEGDLEAVPAGDVEEDEDLYDEDDEE